MARTCVSKVINGRMHFKCPSCQTKRMIGISPKISRRTVVCHNCNETTKCSLNRRLVRREMQGGKIVMYNTENKMMEGSLFDISDGGLGIELSIKDVQKIKVGQKVKINCNWNPELVGKSSYVICSIKDQRVGVKKIR
jgi:transcription elongation factor Elf1